MLLIKVTCIISARGTYSDIQNVYGLGNGLGAKLLREKYASRPPCSMTKLPSIFLLC